MGPEILPLRFGVGVESLDESRRKHHEEKERKAEVQARRRFIDKEVARLGADVREGMHSLGAGVAWAGFWLSLGLAALALALVVGG